MIQSASKIVLHSPYVLQVALWCIFSPPGQLVLEERKIKTVDDKKRATEQFAVMALELGHAYIANGT